MFQMLWYKTMQQWIYCLVLCFLPILTAADVVIRTFSAQDGIENLEFNHLAVDEHTGQVYVGAVNRLYQLMSDLELIHEVETGPSLDSPECSHIECPPTAEKKLTDNVNKALVIDRTLGKLISCGSLSQGVCTFSSLENIKNGLRSVQEPVVANNATASTVMFIGPGPSGQLVLYVGVTYTEGSYYRMEVPAVSSRSLNLDNTLQFASASITTGTRMFVNSLVRENYPINYVFGFSHEGFSYFLTVQMKFSNGGPSQYISKLVRVCQNDPDYYSYTEIPLECKNREGEHYSLVQAAYMGSAGSDLASELGIATQDEVLFVVFSEPSGEYSRQPIASSGLCIYSLKTIRSIFLENIQKCHSGRGNRGLDFIAPSYPCVNTRLRLTETFCGLNVNSPLGGEIPASGVAVITWNERLTAVAASSTSKHTVVFLGTANGHLKKVVVSEGSTHEFSDVAVDEGSAVNADLRFDKDHIHLYVMTRKTVSKVKLHECEAYSSCGECLGARDPYCYWCSPERKCSLLSNCSYAVYDSFYVRSSEDASCTSITSVTPKNLQKTVARTLNLEVENLPSTLEGEFECTFTARGETLVTKGHRRQSFISCNSPRTDLLPDLLDGQHEIMMSLSLRLKGSHEFAATDFPFFDCNTYSNCTGCVNSDFPCDWCVDGRRCTHDSAENCRNDILVTGISMIGPSIRKGPSYCPRIVNSTYESGTEILVARGSTQTVMVRVENIARFIFQTQFRCQFNLEDRVIITSAMVLGDTIYCNEATFDYTSSRPNVAAAFTVMWDNSKALDNPHNIHVLIYRCDKMANDCRTCSTLPEKYGCGWCSSRCDVNEKCEGQWLDEAETCPNPTVHQQIELELENPPSTLEGKLQCSSESKTPSCLTARTDLLSEILREQHELTVVLSARSQDQHEFSETKFTFFDCNTYSSCTDCVSSKLPCEWCIDGHRCTHDTEENCRNDVLISGVSIRPSIRRGPGYCPRMNSTVEGDTEILVAWGSTQKIRIRVDNIAQSIVQTRFGCQFNIEGRVSIKEALLIGDVIYCEDTTFTYNSPRPNITATFAVIWDNFKSLDNPDDIHVLIYRCQEMASNCRDCLSLPEKYECGWCQNASRCDVRGKCEGENATWLDQSGVCEV